MGDTLWLGGSADPMRETTLMLGIEGRLKGGQVEVKGQLSLGGKGPEQGGGRRSKATPGRGVGGCNAGFRELQLCLGWA